MRACVCCVSVRAHACMCVTGVCMCACVSRVAGMRVTGGRHVCHVCVHVCMCHGWQACVSRVCACVHVCHGWQACVTGVCMCACVSRVAGMCVTGGRHVFHGWQAYSPGWGWRFHPLPPVLSAPGPCSCSMSPAAVAARQQWKLQQVTCGSSGSSKSPAAAATPCSPPQR